MDEDAIRNICVWFLYIVIVRKNAEIYIFFEFLVGWEDFTSFTSFSTIQLCRAPVFIFLLSKI